MCVAVYACSAYLSGMCRRKLAELKDLNEALTCQLDDLEQYTRRTNIRIYGIPESNVENADPREDTDNLAMNFVKEE